jgi:hypothetical protein
VQFAKICYAKFIRAGIPQCLRLFPSGRGSAWLERLVRDQEVGGSNPLAPTILFNGPTRTHGLQNVPKTWVTLCGRTDFRAAPERAFQDRSNPDHKADQPDVVVDFFDAGRLAGKDLAEIDLFLAETDASATCDDERLVVERIVDIRQSGVGTRRRAINLCGALHIQGFVRSFVVKDFDEVIESGLLLKEVSGCGLGCLFFQRKMHALMTSVLLRVARLDSLDADPQPEPPHRKPAQVKQSMGRSERNTIVAADVRRQAAFFKKLFKHGKSKVLPGRGKSFTTEQIALA